MGPGGSGRAPRRKGHGLAHCLEHPALVGPPGARDAEAVPWSTEVRTTGSPTVMFTPSSCPITFPGPWHWSWYTADARTRIGPRRNAFCEG